MYTLIYWINKVSPWLAKRLAAYFFPVNDWETPHDLYDWSWADRCIMCEVGHHS